MSDPPEQASLGIPTSHVDLLARPICGVFTTLDASGQPQSSLVWADTDGACARTNFALQRQKCRNVLANPKVCLLIVDPDDTGRYLQIRGDADLVADGAIDHLDALTRAYTGHPRYYGFVDLVERRDHEDRVTCRIRARRIVLDAIHA